MLPRTKRLRRRSFPSGRPGFRASSPHFSLVTGPSLQGGVAVVVSKKVARRSVDRHLVKRRIISLLSPWVDSKRYLVIYAREGSVTLPYRTLAEELTSLLQSSLKPRH